MRTGAGNSFGFDSVGCSDSVLGADDAAGMPGFGSNFAGSLGICNSDIGTWIWFVLTLYMASLRRIRSISACLIPVSADVTVLNEFSIPFQHWSCLRALRYAIWAQQEGRGRFVDQTLLMSYTPVARQKASAFPGKAAQTLVFGRRQ